MFVRRPMFAEEPGLVDYMEKHGICREISVADYESGSWAATVESVFKEHSAAKRNGVPDGSAQVARRVIEIAHRCQRSYVSPEPRQAPSYLNSE